MKVNGREWRWWIKQNSHLCFFCSQEHGAQWARENEIAHLGKQALDIRGWDRGQYTRGYWNTLYYVWLRHMKSCHPHISLENK